MNSISPSALSHKGLYFNVTLMQLSVCSEFGGKS